MSDELDAAERAAVLEEYLSVVRHDLRNCFGTIRNASFYLSRKVKPTPVWNDDERVPRFFDLISEQLVRADEILTEGVTAIGADAGAKRALSDCVRSDVVSLGATYEDDGAHVIGADERALRVAVRCLVRNALERPAGTPPAVTVRKEGTSVRFDVRDDGPALDADALERARVAFRTTKPGHLGIGLNVVDRFASRAGGSFALVADDGRTLARLTLPAISEEP